MLWSLAKRGTAVLGGCVLWLGLAPDGAAQARVAAAAPPAQPASPQVARKPLTVAPQQMAAPRPPTEEPLQPAKVKLINGKLTIYASNSGLGQILEQVAGLSGMTVKGIDASPRIFGVYGPGNWGEVLSELLVGSGYNFMMVGGAAGSAPRELLLTQRVNAGPAVNAPATAEQGRSGESERAITAETEPPETGPGKPPQPSADRHTRMEQNMQRLEHIYEQTENAHSSPQ